jgi:hypothetical protein
VTEVSVDDWAKAAESAISAKLIQLKLLNELLSIMVRIEYQRFNCIVQMV